MYFPLDPHQMFFSILQVNKNKMAAEQKVVGEPEGRFFLRKNILERSVFFMHLQKIVLVTMVI